MSEEEAELKKFIVEKLERLGSISVQNLTGHLSQLPIRVRESTAGSKQQLLRFLRQNSSTFNIDRDGYVNLAANDDQETRSHSRSSSMSSSKGSHAGELPNSINNGTGKIIRMFPMFGFMKAEKPFKTQVYFTALSFGDKSKTLLKDCGVTVGQTLCFNAILGHGGHDSKYRATRVWIPKSEENTSLNASEEPVISSRKLRTRIDNGLYDPHQCEGEGPVQNVFPKYGFIAVEGDPKNTVFFCAKNICNYKNIVDLTQFLSVGDIVDYCAIKSTKPDTNVRWEATQVYIKQAKKKISNPNDSDDEKFITGPGDGTGDKANGGSSRSSRGGREKSSVNNAKISVRSSSSSSSKQIRTNETKPVGIIRDGTGKIYLRPGNAAVIKFGRENSEMAAVDCDAVYAYGSKVEEIAWEVEDGQTVFFNARKTEGPPGWQTSLVWIGSKPENVRDTLTEAHVSVSKNNQDASESPDIQKNLSSKTSSPKVAPPVAETFKEYSNWADAPYSEEEEEEDDLKHIEENLAKGSYIIEARSSKKFESVGNESGRVVNDEFHNDLKKKFDSVNSCNGVAKKEKTCEIIGKSAVQHSSNRSPAASVCSSHSGKVVDCVEDGHTGSVRCFPDSRNTFTVKEDKCNTAAKQNSPASSGVSASSQNEETMMEECADDEDSDSSSGRFYSDPENDCALVEDADTTAVCVTINSQLVSSEKLDSTLSSHSESVEKKEITSLVSARSDGLSASTQNIPGFSSRMGRKSSVLDVRNNGASNENPSRSLIEKFCGICGRIKSLFGYYGEVTCDKLRKPITFHSKDFYINEKPVGEQYSSLKEALKVDEVVYMNCFEIVDDSGTVWQKVTLIWKGKKPRGCKEMLPKEFIKQLSLKVSCMSAPQKSRSLSPKMNVKSDCGISSAADHLESSAAEHLESSAAEAVERNFATQTSCALLDDLVQTCSKDSSVGKGSGVEDSFYSPASHPSSVRSSSSEALDVSACTVIKCDDPIGATDFPVGPSTQINCSEEQISPLVDTKEKCDAVDYISAPVPPQEAVVENLLPPQGAAAAVKNITLQRDTLRQQNLPANIRQISEQLHSSLSKTVENEVSLAFEDSVAKIASAIAKLIDQPVCSRCSHRKEMCDQMVQTVELDSGASSRGIETEVKSMHSVCDTKPQSLVSTAVQTYSTGDILSVDIYPQ